MRLSFLKQRNNRRFNYTPRFYKGKKNQNPYSFQNSFERYRDTHNKNDFRAHWRDERNQTRNRNNRKVSPLLIILILLMTMASLYILDFDFSIF